MALAGTTRRAFTTGLAAAAVAPMAGVARAQPAAAPPAVPPEIHQGRLANGLRYAIVSSPTPKGAVSVRLGVDVGSYDETDDERGLAHFVEHMAFNGTKNFAEDALTGTFARLGVGFGLDLGVRPIPLAYAEIPAQGQVPVHLSWLAPHRGLHQLPVLRVESRYPFGLFRAWTIWRPAGQQWIYPRPESPTPPWPQVEASQGDDRPAARTGSGTEFEGVRAYRRGDTLRQVVWKKAARTGELISRETAGAVQRELVLQWQQAQGLDTEARLARLAAWVVAADAAGHRWGLVLPNAELAPDNGTPHRHAALRALASL